MEDMLQLDWNYPQQPDEQPAFFDEMVEKFALHRLGYISVDYDNAFNKVVDMFSSWDRCSGALLGLNWNVKFTRQRRLCPE